ncbi:MAG: alpha/beta hydrolase [Pseudomonadota bacterium]
MSEVSETKATGQANAFLQPAPNASGFQVTPDGYRLRFAVFSSEARPNKGTVILLHGRNEAIEKYSESISDFLARGFDVATFDWRGQGYSDRMIKNDRPGYVDDYDQYVADLEFMFKTVILPETRAPFFVVAHSMGGLAALVAAPLLANRIRRMLLTTPLLGLGDTAPTAGLLAPAMRAMCFFGLGRVAPPGKSKSIATTPFLETPLTTDLERYERNQKLALDGGPLNLGGPSFAWVNATLKAIARVHEPDHMAKVYIPTLVLTAGADTVVSPTAAQNYARNLRSGAHIMIDGAKHELLQEADRYRDQFFAAFDQFIPGTSV